MFQKITTTLYKKGKHGFNEWTITIAPQSVGISIEYGKQYGKMQHTWVDVVMNQSGRTLEEQALLQYEHRIKKQRRKGYVDSTQEAANTFFFRPMKPKKYDEYKHLLHYPRVSGQPKLNGLRAYTVKTKYGLELRSYSGLVYTKMGHITDELTQAYLDGELYIHNTPLEMIRSKVLAGSKDVRFYVFDDGAKRNIPLMFEDRFKYLQYNFTERPCKYTQLITTTPLKNKQEGDEYFKQCVALGYEGAIYRNNHGYYERIANYSDSILKRKKFINAEFAIVSVTTPDTGEDEGCAIFILDVPGKGTFKASHTGVTKNERRAQYKRKESFIGLSATVKFPNYTSYGIPFNAVIEVIDRNKTGDI